MNGDFGAVLKMVIWCIDSPEKHFAEVNSFLHTKEVMPFLIPDLL